MNYSSQVIDVRMTAVFGDWLEGLRDVGTKARILLRIRRLSLGNFGDAKSVGHGVSEIRIHHGPGYRLYYTRRGRDIVILLCGGNKSSQSRDIVKAQEQAKEV